MKTILIACTALLVIGSAAAEPLDYAPSAQLRYEMKFGATESRANTQALRLAAGVSRPLADDAATPADRQAQAASTAPLISLLDTGYSFGSRQSELRVAGFDLMHREAPALDATRERSWWSSNWGWVVVAGIAAVTIVAVTAIHEGTKDDNRYGDTPSCPGPVSVQNGDNCTRP
ncbi:MAG TPA: hypothetical protein VFB36_08540 [Nevskiaceae bacterium]|nr:hypothetical protein [Nevskiaceae bacterium]